MEAGQYWRSLKEVAISKVAFVRLCVGRGCGFQDPGDSGVWNHLKPLALSALQLDALRRNAGQQASAQTAVFVGLALLLEYSNDTFLHFQSSFPFAPSSSATPPERSLR